MAVATLGLNIIVNIENKLELIRCLESCKGDLFDEIIVTIADKKDNEELRKIIESYNGKAYFFEWIDDFSAARNYSFSKATTDYILWLDSDDVIKPSEYQKLLKLKPSISNYDIILLNYIYAHDDNDRPIVVLPRERIIKNCDYLKWHDPIHEYINLDVPYDKIKRFDITIDHYKKNSDIKRNSTLLGKAYNNGDCSERIKFYYGKELADLGEWEKAVPILESYIEKGADFVDNIVIACIKMCRYYLSINNIQLAKVYAFKGIRYNNRFAEPYVFLGSIFRKEGDIDSAISYYKEALTKKLEAGMSQLVDFYNYIPALELATIYYNARDYENSKYYCELALKYKPEDKQAQDLLKFIINGDNKKVDVSRVLELLKNVGIESKLLNDNEDSFDIRIFKTKNKIKIVWFIPVLDLHNPSIRIRRYNIHNELLKKKIDSQIIFDYYKLSMEDIDKSIDGYNVAIFTQHSKKDLEIIKHLKTMGIKCVYDHCEALFNYPYENECMNECDLIICCSTKLMELTKEHGFNHAVVIKDAVEKLYDNTVYADRYEKPKAVYAGMGGNSWLVTDWLRETIEKAGYELVLITEWDNATKKWSLDTWMEDMLECDVALCPQRVDVQPAKSSIKAITAMGLGLPVVCSDLPSYKEIVKDGENGFICKTLDDWYNALVKLKDSTLREKIGKAGRNSINDYTLPNITNQYVDILSRLINNQLGFNNKVDIRTKSKQAVDIIITNYNNVEYLKLCLNSIWMNTEYPYNIIISDAGSNEETWNYLKVLKGVKILGEKGKRLSYSESCNAGIKASTTKYFVILNSDVIVSKGWLTNLVNKMDSIDRLASCGVLSNCDRGWLHGVEGKPYYPMQLKKSGIELVPGMKLETIHPHLEELYEFMKESNETYKDKFVLQEWVAGYATIYARSAIEEVGLFDPLYKNGCEDLDLMIRLSKYGYKTGQAIDSFVFHFGGISRGAYQNENKEKYDKEDIENHIKLKTKWDKKRVVIWTGPAWEPWNATKVMEGMAGSETWAMYIAREFVKKGYRTIVYNDLLAEDKSKALLDPVIKGDKKIGDVIYRDYRNFLDDIKYDVIDYFICSRTVEPLRERIHSLKNFVMIHDVFLSPDKNYDVLQYKVNKYGCLSTWHKEFVSNHHNINKDKIFVTANGIDINLYKDVDNYTKKNQAVYSSSPDRGLYQLLKMVPLIREKIPDFELIVAYGFYNWESMAKYRNDEASLKFIDKIKSMLNQEGVKYVGRISKDMLAQYQKESKIWIYPTWFSETFCCTAVEVGLAKNAIICTKFAGLIDTVGDAGILVEPMQLYRDLDYPEHFVNTFVQEAIKIMQDDNYRLDLANKAYNKMINYSWEKVANDWITLFETV